MVDKTPAHLHLWFIIQKQGHWIIVFFV